MTERESADRSSDESRRGSLGTRAPVIGLIGPIGCGKSTVAGWLVARGSAIVDADRLTRDLMTPGAPVTESVLVRFGGEYRRPDGSLDRVALGRLVFADPPRLAELEAIVHPAVARLIRDAIRAADAGRPKAIVLEAIRRPGATRSGWSSAIRSPSSPASSAVAWTNRTPVSGWPRRPCRCQCGVLRQLAPFARMANRPTSSAPWRPRSKRRSTECADTRAVRACLPLGSCLARADALACVAWAFEDVATSRNRSRYGQAEPVHDRSRLLERPC